MPALPQLARSLRPLIGVLCLSACERGETTAISVPPEPAHAPTCEGAEALDAVWTDARRGALQAALADVPGEWTTQLVSILDARVDRNGARWRTTYAQACAEDDRRAQRCLDAKLWQLDAVVALASESPLRGAAMWAEIDAALRDAETCADRDDPSFDAPALARGLGERWSAMRLLLANAEDAEVRAIVAQLEAEAAVRETPAYALPLAAAKATVATTAGQLELASTSLATVESLAAELGPRARVSSAQLAAYVALARGDADAGVAALHASVAAAREQDDPWLVFATLRGLGRLLVSRDQAEAALEPLAEAVSLSTRLAGAENPHTAEIQVSLAQALTSLGRVDAAYDLLTQARDSFVNTLGPDHPQTLAAVESIGQLFVRAGQPGDAQFAFLDLLEIYGDLYGPKHWRTAAVQVELGDTLMAMEQHDSARELYTEALVPLVEEFGAGDRLVVRAVVHLGIAEFAVGNLEAAAEHCARGSNLAKALPAQDALVTEASLCVTQLAKAQNKRGKN